jgi:predicted phosphodiesterase
LNSIYNKYPASTCAVQGNNDNQNTRSEADLLNRLEKAFNKVTMQTKETKEKYRKLEIQLHKEKQNIQKQRNSFNKKQNILNSICNTYPASTCSVQGNNDNQNTRSEADLLNRLEKAFN